VLLLLFLGLKILVELLVQKLIKLFLNKKYYIYNNYINIK